MKKVYIKPSKPSWNPPNCIRQHIPNSCDFGDPEIAHFDGTADLLAVPWVKQFKDAGMGRFYRFSLEGHRLMAEYNQGRKWWVIGTLKLLDNVDLPQWWPNRQKVRTHSGL